MPMGPAPFGFAYFVGVKAAGYCAAARVLNHVYENSSPNHPSWWRIGVTRTAIGIAAGVTYGGVWLWTKTESSLFLAGLLPIRLAEWLVVIWIFYDRQFVLKKLDAKAVAGGTIWSYALDALAIGAALVLPGGMWVC